MERNDGPPADRGGMPGANEFSGSGSPNAGTPADAGQRPIDSFDFSGTAGVTGQESARARAREAISGAGERLADVGTGLRERAGAARERLADVLESGAERLRERGARHSAAEGTPDTSSATFAGVTGGGTVSVESDGVEGTQVAERVAGGMDAAANWLRDADVQGLKDGIERQVREHPARTLLIAAGVGYLLGRAFRKDH